MTKTMLIYGKTNSYFRGMLFEEAIKERLKLVEPRYYEMETSSNLTYQEELIKKEMRDAIEWCRKMIEEFDED